MYMYTTFTFYCVSVTKLMWFRERVDEEKQYYTLDEMLELIDRFVSIQILPNFMVFVNDFM